ncbi:MAG TPA: hypothetical protein DCF33_13955, partial [Saprospirales bacterium]|nr:hypothetical protein [Saprospirales bacterium]
LCGAGVLVPGCRMVLYTQIAGRELLVRGAEMLIVVKGIHAFGHVLPLRSLCKGQEDATGGDLVFL